MKVIAMGYTGTGSSAVIHLLKEYTNCFDIDDKNYEHNLLYLPHGLFDFEDALLKNNSLYKSDAAINDFYNQMKNLNDFDYGWYGGYKKKFGTKFMDAVDELIDQLVIYTRPGGWSNDYIYEYRFDYFLKDICKKMLGKEVREFGKRINYDGQDGIVKYALPSPDEFYNAARRFLEKYYELVGYDKDKVMIFDQLLEPQQLYRISNYFDDDIRCIVVDRDPRDMYLLSKYIWSKNTSYSIVPTEIDEFISFYTRLYDSEKFIEDSRILRIHFEDLIYNYDVTINRIENFIGKKYLGEHKYKKQFFNPNESIKNTQIFNVDEIWKEESSIILDSTLMSHVYKFPYSISAKLEEMSDPNPDTSIKTKKYEG